MKSRSQNSSPIKARCKTQLQFYIRMASQEQYKCPNNIAVTPQKKCKEPITPLRNTRPLKIITYQPENSLEDNGHNTMRRYNNISSATKSIRNFNTLNVNMGQQK